MPNSQDDKQIQVLGQRILLACVTTMGGVVPLARYLRVSDDQVREWITGKTVPPVAIVMKAIDPVIGDREAIWREPRGDSEERKLQ